MANFFCATGCRLGTALEIRVGDINFDENTILFRHTKNRAQQLLPLSVTLKPILLNYCRYRKPKTDEDYLFCTQWGDKLSSQGCINAMRNSS